MSKPSLGVAAVTTLAVALSPGALAPVSTAASGKQPSRKVNTVKALKTTKLPQATLLGAARRKVVAEISRDHTALGRTFSRPSLRPLVAGAQTRLAASVAADQAVLAELAHDARAATSLAELQGIASVVRSLRPETYSVAVGYLRDLAALVRAAETNSTVLADVDTIVIEREAAGEDVTVLRVDLASARLLNAEATLAAPSARDAALQLTARSSRTRLQVVTREILRISDLLDRVDESIMLIELVLAAPLAESAQPEPAA